MSKNRELEIISIANVFLFKHGNFYLSEERMYEQRRDRSRFLDPSFIAVWQSLKQLYAPAPKDILDIIDRNIYCLTSWQREFLLRKDFDDISMLPL